MSVCMSLTCTFIGIIVVVVLVISVVLIRLALFRHFYSWTALRELHKGIEFRVLVKGVALAAACQTSQHVIAATINTDTDTDTLSSYSAPEMYSHTFSCYGILLAAFYLQRVSRQKRFVFRYCCFLCRGEIDDSVI